MQTFADGALKLTREGACARLTLARPDRRNAINAAMWRAFGDVAASVDADPGVKVLVVCGQGGHFAAGADIAEFGAVCATPELTGVYAAAVHDGLLALSRMSKPTLAMIEGFCIGGGMALALACDIRMAAQNARFAVTPAKLGIVYNMFDTSNLVAAVGPSMARDILYTGRILPSDEARAVGLIDFVLPDADLADAVQAKADLICANSQWSVRGAKRMVRRAMDGQSEDDAVTRQASVDGFHSPDFDEGRSAFLAKRTPEFPFS